MADNFIIKDVRIFTGTSEIPSGYVSVSSGKITSFGAGSPANVPEGTKVFSKPGHTLLPGFIDAHIHADKGKELALYQALRFGVTTVMDMHNEFPNVDKLKKIAADGEELGRRLQVLRIGGHDRWWLACSGRYGAR